MAKQNKTDADNSFLDELLAELEAGFSISDFLVWNGKHLGSNQSKRLLDILSLLKAHGTTLTNLKGKKVFHGRTARIRANKSFQEITQAIMGAHDTGILTFKNGGFNLLIAFRTTSMTVADINRAQRRRRNRRGDDARLLAEATRATAASSEQTKKANARAKADKAEEIRQNLQDEKEEVQAQFEEARAEAAVEVADLEAKEVDLVEEGLERQNNLNTAILEQPNQVEIPDPTTGDLRALKAKLDDMKQGEIPDLGDFDKFAQIPTTASDPERSRVIESIRRHSQAENAQLLIDRQLAEQKMEAVEELRLEIRSRLSRVDQFLSEHKEQMVTDGLIRRMVTGDPSDGMLDMVAAVEDITAEIGENGITDNVLDRLRQIYIIMSHDTQAAFVSVLRNRILSFDFSGGVVHGVATKVLIRLLGRLVYADLNADVEAAIQAFLERGIPLVGRALRVMSRVLTAMQGIIPPPPPLPEEVQARLRRPAFGNNVIPDDIRAFMGPNQERFRLRARSEAKSEEGIVVESDRQIEQLGIVRAEEKQEDIEGEFMVDYETTFANLATGAAKAAAVFATTAKNEAIIMQQEIINMAKGVLPDIRPGFAPDQAANIAGRVADHIIPIIERNPAARRLPRGRLTRLVKGTLLAALIGLGAVTRNAPTQETKEAPRKPPREGRPAGDSSEAFGGVEIPIPQDEIDTPQGVGELRAQFMQTGTSYLDRIYNTPMQTQNSEWTEFDYVQPDRANGIIEDNSFGQAMRYREPMFLPKYQAPVRPPSRRAILRTADTLRPQIQLTQQWQPKFDGAVTRYDALSEVQPKKYEDPFERSWTDNILYHPI